MYKHLLICNIYFIFIQGKIIPPVNVATKPTLSVISSEPEKMENSTQPMIGEGGSVMPSNQVTLPNGNYIALMNLEKEMSGNKEKSVVARKGVTQDGIKTVDNSMAINDTSTAHIGNNTNQHVIIQPDDTILNGNNVTNDNDVKNVKDTKPHKPLVVSSEALAKMDKINNVYLDESNASVKVSTIKASSHPGMIMPIVITILVVPMFAVVSYMALKRGKEAWKNRHYKRMDFLLDGMYND